jgi:hypothetical protein
MPTISTILAQDVQFNIYKGDSFQVVLTFTDENNDPINLSTAAVKMQIKKIPTLTSALLTIDETTGIVVSGADSNIVTIDKIIDLAAGVYFYDIQMTFSSKVVTYVKGRFVVNQDITI